MYFVLAFAMFISAYKNKLNLSTIKMYLLVGLVGIAYGTIIELIQGFYIYQRFFDALDITANIFGTIFGVLTARLICIKLV